jgi:2-aminoadipate transaminase
VPPLRAFDRRDQVVLLGTLSKMLFPGFRIGWLVSPPQVHRRLLDMRRACELSPALLPQMVVAELLTRGLLDRHLERVNRELERRLDALLTAADQYLPSDTDITRPEGGMSVWVTLPETLDSEALLESARRRGMLFAPGSWFFADGSGHHHLRLTFGFEPSERVARGVRILGEAIERQLARGHTPRLKARPVEERPFL